MARPRREARAADDTAKKPKVTEREKEKLRSSQREKVEPERGKRSSRDQPKPKKHAPSSSQSSNSQALSADSLAKLNAEHERGVRRAREKNIVQDKEVAKQRLKPEKRHQQSKKKRRVVSGAAMEEGRAIRKEKRLRGGGGDDDDGAEKRNRRCIWITIVLVILLLVILIPVGVLVIGKNNPGSSTEATDGSSPSNSNLQGISQSDIPTAAKGTILDPFSWYDTEDFNITYTDAKVGGLPIMGLNSTWDDTKKCNDDVPALNETWQYGSLPIRGVNIGGWLSLEPFITPSLFNSYDSKLGIVDEYTLSKHLGAKDAARTLEKHYSTFVNEQTFIDIAKAGLDHVRIPYSYWAVVTYPGDPYVPQISWRYLLRGIEWARKHGLRVNLDLHALPGSQNGWNHSGRQGLIGWLNGTDGTLNGQRALDIHGQLSTFFAQPRYKNVIAIYGLANEPKMTKLPLQPVLDWTTNAVNIVQKNGITAKIAFGDGFLGLPKWQGQLSGLKNLVLDAHQYVIFNTDQLAFSHKTKIQFACSGWTADITQSQNTGFGPTLCGEWSQADTDCTQYLNNVNVGSRWEGTFNVDPLFGNSVTTPTCPQAAGGKCSCDEANADPSRYSASYKDFLRMFAEAQMAAFESGWGWFYWTWDTEAATQWSWKKGLAAGILPNPVSNRNFNCSETVPDYADLSETF